MPLASGCCCSVDIQLATAGRTCGEKETPAQSDTADRTNITVSFLKAALVLLNSSDPENIKTLTSFVSRTVKTLQKQCPLQCQCFESIHWHCLVSMNWLCLESMYWQCLVSMNWLCLERMYWQSSEHELTLPWAHLLTVSWAWTDSAFSACTGSLVSMNLLCLERMYWQSCEHELTLPWAHVLTV
jgi:hypothetical protein